MAEIRKKIIPFILAPFSFFDMVIGALPSILIQKIVNFISKPKSKEESYLRSELINSVLYPFLNVAFWITVYIVTDNLIIFVIVFIYFLVLDNLRFNATAVFQKASGLYNQAECEKFLKKVKRISLITLWGTLCAYIVVLYFFYRRGG